MANVTYSKDMTIYGGLILADKILEKGAVAIRDGIIVYAGPEADAPVIGQVRRTDKLIAPGYVDIHCHAGGETPFHEDPQKVLDYHLSHGTTGILATFYRDLWFEKTLEYTNKMKAFMGGSSTLLGVHLEGPYLNPRYGTMLGIENAVDPEQYKALADTGIIRQWTYAPEVPGTGEFVRYIASKGIVPAIGHTEATPAQVYAAPGNGAKIVTHLFDAMGNPPTLWCGTEETNTSTACLVCDGFYYEIICDRKGIHVRPDKIRLAIKAVGTERIVGITDCFMGAEDGSDVNFIDGILSGSKLTMEQVARNFLALGLTVPQVLQITAANPAAAIGMADVVGSLKPGCRGDLLLVDEKLELYEVIKAQCA